MPLLLFCIDCSRFLRHVAYAADNTPGGIIHITSPHLNCSNANLHW
jgi:hypothetical protein